ncbi:MAG: DNA polymerase III subunit delta [Chloroflexi bacterium]|nr:DNA polymerase III subunit delta [Anaerolineaceae bacterium]NMB89603.1 DNA polymerase III subunit delta [Chloroflexota bacterium]
METPAPSSESKPVAILLHGEDEFAMGRFVDGLVEKMGDPGTAELNTTRLDGRQCTLDDIRAAALALPFLADRRLVIVTHPLAHLGQAEAQQRFRDLLDGLPDSTALVLLIPDTARRRRGSLEWEVLREKHWLVAWARQAGSRAVTKAFPLPGPSEMPEWIRQQARRQGGQFTPAAAQSLAGHVDSDTRLAELEIDKLLTYVNWQRPVEVEDVEALTAAHGQVNVFDMVDALAAGNANQAMRLLEGLLEQDEAAALFAMVVRQFRLLLQAREVLDEGGNAHMIESELRQHPFVAGKLETQARRFSLPQLESVYRRLLDLDEAFKTSQITYDLALEMLVAEMGR